MNYQCEGSYEFSPPAGAVLYADGGVIRKNPSPFGGTWACCWVLGDVLVKEESGLVLPGVIGLPSVSNNVTELVAVLEGLKYVPAGWDGAVYTDSGVTRTRLLYEDAGMVGVPETTAEAVKEMRRRLGKFTVVLLGGHPTRKELAAGVRKDGKPVSKWNVRCDESCGRLAAEFLCQKAKEVVL
jgi:ribonuclease HI